MRSTLLMLTLLVGACDDGGGDPVEPSDVGGQDQSVDDSTAPDSATDGAVRDAARPDSSVPDSSVPDAAVDATRPDSETPDVALQDVGDDAEASDAALPVPDGNTADIGAPDVPNLGECSSPADCLDFRACEGGACVDSMASDHAGDLILNEILIDGALDVDANDDGDISAVGDEFIELVNVTEAAIDLGGFLVVERDLQGIPRHVFPDGATLPAGEALVLFGGGAPSDDLASTPGASFLVVNAADPAFENGLNLDDAGDTLRVLDPVGHEVIVFSYGANCARPPCAEIAADRSLTRVPDLIGDFAEHPDEPISPGTRADGDTFE